MGYDSLRAGQRVFIPADWEVVIAWPPLSLVARASSRQRERKVVGRMTGVEPYLTDAIKPLNTSDLAALTA